MAAPHLARLRASAGLVVCSLACHGPVWLVSFSRAGSNRWFVGLVWFLGDYVLFFLSLIISVLIEPVFALCSRMLRLRSPWRTKCGRTITAPFKIQLVILCYSISVDTCTVFLNYLGTLGFARPPLVPFTIMQMAG